MGSLLASVSPTRLAGSDNLRGTHLLLQAHGPVPWAWLGQYDTSVLAKPIIWIAESDDEAQPRASYV